MKRIKVFCYCTVILMLVTFLSVTVSAISAANHLEQKVFRLHVVGASNSSEDQILKYKVRDALLKASEGLFENAKTAKQAKQIAEDNKSVFEEAALKELKINNSGYSCSVTVSNKYFPTKEYENNMILPAGNYDALVVKIGEAKGENWWCVMFPEVCLSGAVKSSMKDVLKEDELKLTQKPKTKSAKIKFKTVELFNMLKESVKEITE